MYYFLVFLTRELMIGSSTTFVNASFPHLLSELEVIVFGKVGEALKVSLVDTTLLFWEECK